MIESTLGFIEQTLNQHLVSRFALNEGVVSLNSLTTLVGGQPEANQNKLILTMINLSHETDRRETGMHRSADGQLVIEPNPAQHYSVNLLFTANFADYNEALKYLSAAISFFQANSTFNSSTHSNIPAGVSTLYFETEDISLQDMHNLWRAMRASYQPSIIYKVRHITIETDEKAEINDAVMPNVTGIDIDTNL